MDDGKLKFQPKLEISAEIEFFSLILSPIGFLSINMGNVKLYLKFTHGICISKSKI